MGENGLGVPLLELADGSVVYVKKASLGDFPRYENVPVAPLSWPEWLGQTPRPEDMIVVSISSGGLLTSLLVGFSPVPHLLTVHSMTRNKEFFLPSPDHPFDMEVLVLLVAKMMLDASNITDELDEIVGEKLLILSTYRESSRLNKKLIPEPLTKLGKMAVLNSLVLQRYQVGFLWRGQPGEEDGVFFAKRYMVPGGVTPLIAYRRGSFAEISKEDVKRLERMADKLDEISREQAGKKIRFNSRGADVE